MVVYYKYGITLGVATIPKPLCLRQTDQLAFALGKNEFRHWLIAT